MTYQIINLLLRHQNNRFQVNKKINLRIVMIFFNISFSRMLTKIVSLKYSKKIIEIMQKLKSIISLKQFKRKAKNIF